MKHQWIPKESDRIKYKKSKYTLANHIRVITGVSIPEAITSYDGFVTLSKDGWLTIRPGFSWDGPSGPTFDTKSTMMASCAHDALYLLHREGKLDQLVRTTISDPLLKRLMIKDGAWEWRADAWLWAVRTFAKDAAKKQKEKYYYAP